MQNKSKELEVAINAALEAGKIVKKHFENGIEKEHKENIHMADVVTEADRESETIIRKIILESFPSHSIMGEEGGMIGDKSEYVWHVDPIDGTANFASGLPVFGISIALARGNELLLGVIYNPIVGDLLYAEKGKGAYLNSKRMQVSDDDVKKGMYTIGAGRTLEDRKLFKNLYFNLPDKIRYARMFGCTVMELSYVARGSSEAHIVLGLNSYDFAAGVLLVQESGGKITKLDGSAWAFPENYFIASNGVFHDLLIEEVQKQIKNLAPSA
ncbi:inositol monophosphatase [Candidatus Nomurabacteria bacterium]|nr:inositol monophosphatase [Candidatus Nomurabacteria bacterium]